MRFRFGDEFLEFILRFEMVEKDAALVKGTDVWDEVLGVAINEAVGGSHMEEETVADEFSGGVIFVGTI